MRHISTVENYTNYKLKKEMINVFYKGILYYYLLKNFKYIIFNS